MIRRFIQIGILAALAFAAVPASPQQFYANIAGTATGGIATSDGAGNTVITFIASGTLNLSVPVTAKAVVCAAGGGGASGGGSAGQCVTGLVNIPAGSTAVTVGIGGVGGTANNTVTLATAGTGSSLGALLSATGGGFGVATNQTTATNGGGCPSSTTGTCAASAGTQPFAGGSVTAILTPYGAGGGSGALGAGQNTAGGATGGNGGLGLTSLITGTSSKYGYGGGGGVGGVGTGGVGDGVLGHGSFNTNIGIPATPRSGSGGAGTGFNNNLARGGSGSNGIVIISCPTVSCGTPPTVTPSVRQIATHTYVLSSIVASTTGWNSRSPHFNRAGNTVTSLQIDVANWYTIARVGEACPGGTLTVNASIEYPQGTYTPITFNTGFSSVVIADCGESGLSDAISTSIPNGALFWIKLYEVPSANILQAAVARANNTALGEAVNNSNVNETATTSANTAGTHPITPIAIVASSSQPAIGVGSGASSRTVGDGDPGFDTNGDTGYTRFYGRYFAYIDTSLGGDTVIAGFTSGPKRQALIAAYTQILWLDPGLNDPLVGNSLASVQTALLAEAAGWAGGPTKVIFNNEAAFTTCGTIANMSPSLNYSGATTYGLGDWVISGGSSYVSLISNNLNNTPVSSPTDWQLGTQVACSGWNQSEGQVPIPNVEPFRIALNSWLSTLTGYNQLVDVNSFEGAGSQFQYWNTLTGAQPGATATQDGVHENTAILNLDVGKPIFNPNLITLP